jgi:hypothetical protein
MAQIVTIKGTATPSVQAMTSLRMNIRASRRQPVAANVKAATSDPNRSTV